MLEPVTPALGPETTLKVIVKPGTGFSVPATVAVTVWLVQTGFVAHPGAKTMQYTDSVGVGVTVVVGLGVTVAVGDGVGEGVGVMAVQVFVTVFEVTAAFCSFTKLAVIVSVPGEPFDV